MSKNGLFLISAGSLFILLSYMMKTPVFLIVTGVFLIVWGIVLMKKSSPASTGKKKKI